MMNFILSFAEIVLDLPIDYDWDTDFGNDPYAAKRLSGPSAPAEPALIPDISARESKAAV